MLSENVIEPPQTEWAASILFPRQKDGSKRFCGDDRKWNAVAKWDDYPIPRLYESMNSFGKATFFSTLDANIGYRKIEMSNEYRDTTVFMSHYGLHLFFRKAFRLRNAPNARRRLMDVALSALKWKFSIVYFDSIFVFSCSAEKKIDHVRQILTLLRNAGVTVILLKCTLRVNHRLLGSRYSRKTLRNCVERDGSYEKTQGRMKYFRIKIASRPM